MDQQLIINATRQHNTHNNNNNNNNNNKTPKRHKFKAPLLSDIMPLWGHWREQWLRHNSEALLQHEKCLNRLLQVEIEHLEQHDYNKAFSHPIQCMGWREGGWEYLELNGEAARATDKAVVARVMQSLNALQALCREHSVAEKNGLELCCVSRSLESKLIIDPQRVYHTCTFVQPTCVSMLRLPVLSLQYEARSVILLSL